MKRALIVVALCAVVGAALFLAPAHWRRRLAALVRPSAGAGTGAALPAGAGTEEVTCWYPPRTGLEPVPEKRRIAASATPQERLTRLLTELHRLPDGAGADPALPPGYAPRTVFLAGDGTVYADLPSAAFERLLGPRDELVLLRSIARTCLSNVPEARALVVLMDGAPRTTLFSHYPGGGRYLLPRVAPERGTKRGRAAPR